MVSAAPLPSGSLGAPAPPLSCLDLVLVHRGEPELIGETVAAFLDQGVPVRIVVVDNGSPRDELDDLRDRLPDEVVVLPLGTNRGFGPGANAGLRWFLQDDGANGGLPRNGHPDAADAANAADRRSVPPAAEPLTSPSTGAEWLAVAPHDARPAADCLRTLLAELERQPRAGLASADVGDGLTPVVDRYFGAIPEPARVVRGWEPAGYPHGTLLVARRSCLEEVGLFDERYFAYCEEADLALRARRAGWQVGVVRGAEVRNGTIGSRVAVVDYLQLRNTLLLIRDHFGRYAVTVRIVTALCQLAAGLASPRHRGPYWSPRARIRAVADYLRHRFGPPPPTVVRDRPELGTGTAV